jgi:outer membrane protein OmpA-like peptidoglycan-associated protein
VPDAQDKCPGTDAELAAKTDTAETVNGFEDEDGCPDSKGKVLVVMHVDKIEILEQVFFAVDKDVIQEKSFALLKQVALVVKAHPEIPLLRIEGHTDNVGAAARNKDLSERRAKSVRRFLVGEGVPNERLISRGYGAEVPLVANDTEANKATNRRVQFTILSSEEAAKTPADPLEEGPKTKAAKPAGKKAK